MRPSFRIIVVDHPDQLKDKEQMTRNRKHVMYDFLEKERMNPHSTDPRIKAHNATDKDTTKRPKTRKPRGKTLTAAVPKTATMKRKSSSSSRASSGSSPERNHHLDATYQESCFMNYMSPEPAQSIVGRAWWESSPNSTVQTTQDILGEHSSQYSHAPTIHLPTPAIGIGPNLEPHDTLPTFSDPILDTKQLQSSSSRNFGNAGLEEHWLPTLLQSKHAYLSTICISSSHDDIMQRGIQAPHERLPHGSLERQKARTEVIGLINQAIRDPQMQTADATIVAVLHLLNSEIMGCDDRQMRLHQRGLHDMIRLRGGIGESGIDGQLALILTITMYMISALRETEPHSDFVRYASRQPAKPHSNSQQLFPESPVYCRPSGFDNAHQSIARKTPTAHLLEDLRLITNAFIKDSRTTSTTTPSTPVTTYNMSNSSAQSRKEITLLYDKIFSLRPANEHPEDFHSANDQATYEALRLTALVYAHALAKSLPFSRAAAELSLAAFTNDPTAPAESTSWHILIKHALIRTDLSDIWSHGAGVLFWIALVAGACANPDADSNRNVRAMSAEEEEARKWLAAVAVRCSIVLSFQHGACILETLKRLVAIEQALQEREKEREEREAQVQGDVSMWESSSGGGMFGPNEVPLGQKGMQDFAMDFLDDW